ncbi:LacI family DNA-binding transcriptional regulator [Algoriphagus sp. SE2]|uniref:LacI family DNA-binding transcriptional regulator n=1 Tax=Algoriphagus sp. SE2 TaxID=3141536 RepID=UPI0031CD35DD
MKLGQATIKDIAKELKISVSTVSRALKDYPGISDETKRKVKEVAEKMNYRPNAIALSLRKSKSFTIGVIIPEVVHFFFSTVISGIEEVANSRGYNVILTQTNEKIEREKSSINTMLSNQIDGFMISFSKETTNFDHFSKLLDQNYPIVFFDRVPDIPQAINVMVDDYQGAYDATAHLIAQGYDQIVHLAGPKNLSICLERERGYRDALTANGISINENFIVECHLGTPEESKEITQELLNSSKERPNAIFANNDIVAVGAMMACKEAGLRIPEDIGIVGFSNWQICSMLEPTLTSVYQPGFNIGKKATELLLDMIEKKIEPDQIDSPIILKTELIPRKSSQRMK